MSDDFDWGILEVPTARAMVRGQLEFSWWDLRRRFAGITDAEYRWEPAPGAWTVRRRAEARGTPVGIGEWVAEWPGEGEPTGTRTIAWLVAHLTDVFFERWEWTFGEHRRRRIEIEVHPDAAAGIAGLTRWVDAWRAGIAELADDDVFTVGRSQATEIDAIAPFGHLVLHVNRELTVHGGEIGSLLDLQRS